MWHLRPASSGHEIIDLDDSSAALPIDPDAETRSTKRRRKETPRPRSLSVGQPLSEMDKQRLESVATALQLYSNPEEAGIKLLLPYAMDLTDNPFTHCPTEQLAASHVLPARPVGPVCNLQPTLGWLTLHARLEALVSQHCPAVGLQKHLLRRLLTGSLGWTARADATLPYG